MADPFDSPAALVTRAREHIQAFDWRFRNFLSENPTTRLVNIDPHTGDELHIVKILKPIPNDISVVAYDIINCLRSSLDHAVYAASIVLGDPDPTNTKFPFADKRDRVAHAIELTRAATRGGIPASLDRYLIGLEPHGDAGGDHALWGLNKLRNIKIHRKLIKFGFDVNNVNISNGFFIGDGSADGSIQFPHEWNSAEDEFTYLRIPRGTRNRYNLDIGVYPALGDVPGLGGKKAIPSFDIICSKAKTVIEGLSAECNRIRGA